MSIRGLFPAEEPADLGIYHLDAPGLTLAAGDDVGNEDGKQHKDGKVGNVPDAFNSQPIHGLQVVGRGRAIGDGEHRQ